MDDSEYKKVKRLKIRLHNGESLNFPERNIVRMYDEKIAKENKEMSESEAKEILSCHNEAGEILEPAEFETNPGEFINSVENKWEIESSKEATDLARAVNIAVQNFLQ